ncbi:MAG: class I SAM-dependent methyltransferase [Ignavibacteriales bacterium]|nr:class I SAM-dependent methyltransferase [Ignavibacteriales bacterium]
MIIEEFRDLKTVNGVVRISEVDDAFEKLYLQVRKKENRIYSDDEIKLLPYASKINPHKNEWALRSKSFLRFKEYLSHKKSKLNILDLGCGNGWLTGQLVKEFEHNYFCVDVNLTELEQAAKVFDSDNLKFIYADIFATTFPANTFDIVIINSALQYFQNISALMKELFFISKTYGEIHIIDTPFYDKNEPMQAKNELLNIIHRLVFLKWLENIFTTP